MGKSSFLQEFKAFAMKGNVVDMAVGVIIGGAFGKIVSSVVADVIMPPLGLLIGGVNFTDLTYIIHSGFISGYQNRYGDNLKPPTNVYHRMTA